MKDEREGESYGLVKVLPFRLVYSAPEGPLPGHPVANPQTHSAENSHRP